MSDAVLIELVKQMPAILLGAGALLASIGTLAVSLLNRGDGKKRDAKLDVVAGKIEMVHLATNSMKDALVSSTRDSALQEGHTAGVADEKATAALLRQPLPPIGTVPTGTPDDPVAVIQVK